MKEFALLERYDQAQVTWLGTCLDTVKIGNNRFWLYDLGSFYIEANFDISEHRFVDFKAFKNTLYLSPYLEQYDISPVLK